MAKLLVIHGTNLNLLGTREQDLYGTTSLKSLNEKISKLARDHEVECYQSNAEHKIIEKIHAHSNLDFLIINPGALTHTSIALRDALLAVKLPFIEVHLTNIYARETFRHHSYLSDIAVGIICGLGPVGYYAAVTFALEKLTVNHLS